MTFNFFPLGTLLTEKGYIRGPFGSALKRQELKESGIPVYEQQQAIDGHRRFRFFVDAEKHEELKRFTVKENDLIVSCSGTVGRISVIEEGDPLGIISQALLILRPRKESLLPRFLYYFLQSPQGKSELLNASHGAVQLNIAPRSVVEKIPTPVPEIWEQDRIVETLKAFDDRITLLRETNATLEAIAQTLFKSWFIDFAPIRAKQNGQIPEGMDEATAAQFPDSFEESALGLVPKGWTSVPVYDLATYINGASYKAFGPNLERRGLPIIKIAELKNGVTAQTAYSDIAMPEKYRIQTEDILFSWSGNPDTSIDTFVWPHDQAWLNQHIFRVLPHETIERSFLLQTLKYLRPVFAELARNKQTTGLGHVTVADLKRLRVVKPSMPVLVNFDRITASIHNKIFNNEQKAQTLAVLRDTLLPRLISGQLRIAADESEPDPSEAL